MRLTLKSFDDAVGWVSPGTQLSCRSNLRERSNPVSPSAPYSHRIEGIVSKSLIFFAKGVLAMKQGE